MTSIPWIIARRYLEWVGTDFEAFTNYMDTLQEEVGAIFDDETKQDAWKHVIATARYVQHMPQEAIQ